MSTVSILLGLPQKGTRIARNVTKLGVTSAIFLDATLSENFTAEAEVTQHPVENGIDISDHIILKPKKLSIDGIISETPFSSDSQIAGLATSVAASIGQEIGGAYGGLAATLGINQTKTMAGLLTPKSVTGGTVRDTEGEFRDDTAIPSENSRLRDAMNEFELIRLDKQPLTIITGLKKYENYVLTSFQVRRDTKSGQSIQVHLELSEFQVASSQSVKIAVPKTKAAVKKVEQGRKNGQEVEQKKSWLKSTIGFFKGG